LEVIVRGDIMKKILDEFVNLVVGLIVLACIVTMMAVILLPEGI
jgi:hypothetical protein